LSIIRKDKQEDKKQNNAIEAKPKDEEDESE
jgi:hypothetical protein